MISVTGRRRVGKTFLVTTAYREHIVFEITGIQGASLNKQLKNFRDELAGFAGAGLPLETPADWLSAFQLLKQYLKTRLDGNKPVLFFDELPWLANPKSGFLEAFGYFWNSWASRQNLVVVICGSAASWMIRKVVHNKGGLHNRITRHIHLLPFSLGETEAYLKSRGVHLDRYQMLHIYMAIGGVPHYLKAVKGGLSAAQNIDQICFSDTGLLKSEFSKLYPALFKSAERHTGIIRSIAGKWQGMNRTEMLENTKAVSGGGLTAVLEELVQSGFITAYVPFGKKKKEKLYRLTDEYSLFYLQFMEGNTYEGEGFWQHLSQTQDYKSWSGYAFESICLKHLPQIKKALGISGIYSHASAFYHKGGAKEKGAQIDLVLDRKDHVVNLFEVKFYNESFTPDQAFANSLREKMAVFKASTQTRKQIFWTLITTFGLTHNQYSLGLVDTVLTMDALFDLT